MTGSTSDFPLFEDIHLYGVFLHTRRWRSLQIIGGYNEGISRVLRPLGVVSVPRLEKLSIRGVADGEVAHYMVFASGAPMLSNVKLTGIELSPHSALLPMIAITTLYIEESSFASYDHILQFLRAAPLLADLTLAVDVIDDAQPPSANSGTALSIPTLITFEIICVLEEEVEYLRDLCAMVITPALQCLKLNEIYPPALAPFAERLCMMSQGDVGLYPALRSLHC
jgi:hypothetical protein